MARIQKKKTSSFRCAFLAGAIGLSLSLGGCMQLQILTPSVSNETSAPILNLAGPIALYTGECSATPYTVKNTNSVGTAAPVSSNTVVTLSQSSGEGALFYSDSSCSIPVMSVTIPSGQNQIQFYAKDNLSETPVISSSTAGGTGSSLTLTMSARFHQVDLLTGGLLGVGSVDGPGATARFSTPSGNARRTGHISTSQTEVTIRFAKSKSQPASSPPSLERQEPRAPPTEPARRQASTRPRESRRTVPMSTSPTAGIIRFVRS